MTILDVKELCKTYGKETNIITALNNVSFNVNEGEFISIIGASGSGKSTLLHLLGCVDEPTSGQVLLNDKNIYSLNDDEQSKLRRNKIGLIYQFYNLIPTLNVKENILLPLLFDDKEVDKNYFDELVNLLDLQDRLTHLPNQLSGGQQQRVAIARALINRPSIVLADEPTGNLDSKNSLEIMNLLKQANKKYNQTIIVVTHDMELAKYANRILTIEDGRIIDDRLVNNYEESN